MRCSNLTGERPRPGTWGGLSGAPCGPKQEPGTVPALLELAVEEDPNNDRNVHYLGREYFFFYRRWEESIAMLKRHLALPTATWADERCASMRLLAKDYFALEMAGRRNGGFSGRLARHPISGSPGWTWRTWPTTKRTGTVCSGPQAGPWPSPSGP